MDNMSPTGVFVESLGYPGDYGSYQMVYTSGDIDYSGYNVFQFYDDLDLMPGQSGSPLIYTNAYTGEVDIIGIVSHHRYFPTLVNGALKLTDSMVDQIKDWADTSENNPVSDIIFNETWYLSQNPDIAAAVNAGGISSGKAHFESHGWQEGRDPCENFDTDFYLNCYPDIKAAQINPFDHYLASGQFEGRLPAIDAADYLTRYPDVAANYPGPAADHYALYGQYEGRTAKSPSTLSYDESDYIITGVPQSTSVELTGVQQTTEPDLVI